MTSTEKVQMCEIIKGFLCVRVCASFVSKLYNIESMVTLLGATILT